MQRAQSALRQLADFDVLLLDLITEVDGLLQYFSAVSEPLEYRQCAVRTQRQNDVAAHIVRVDIQHEIGEYPVIQRALAAVSEIVAAVARGALADGRDVRGVIAERFDAVLRVIQLSAEGGMGRRQMVSLQV